MGNEVMTTWSMRYGMTKRYTHEDTRQSARQDCVEDEAVMRNTSSKSSSGRGGWSGVRTTTLDATMVFTGIGSFVSALTLNQG